MRRLLSFFTLVFCLLPIPSLAQEIYRVGPVEVRIYDDPKQLWKDLPAPVQVIYEAIGGVTIKGFVDIHAKRIYSVKDWCVVMHEFKHYLDPDWRHEPFSDKTPCEEFRIK